MKERNLIEKVIISSVFVKQVLYTEYYLMLPVSLDCPFLIAPSEYSLPFTFY
jgi:hypothetical protein